jgi:RsiW-degrading membrane proteinase PrsW (M82 family)
LRTTTASLGASRGASRVGVGSALLRPWLLVLIGGAVLWAALTWATIETGNLNLVPSVIVLGAFLGPVAFVAWVYDRARELPLPTLLICFVTGGALGVTGASLLEYRTMIDLGALPTVAVGLAEESCKLIVPLAIFLSGRYRREADGLLIGVASGMGFAAFETMGYGLTALLVSQGRIDEVVKLLFVRGVLAPAGHAAWTGLMCAALWHARLRPGVRSAAVVVGAFLTVVTLHALWDAATTQWVQLAVGAVSLTLVLWRLHAASAEMEQEPSAERDALPGGAPYATPRS